MIAARNTGAKRKHRFCSNQRLSSAKLLTIVSVVTFSSLASNFRATWLITPRGFQLPSYKVTENLARHGRTAEAIDICLKLRADPSRTIWNRPLVNLLLATEVDVEDHPDAAKFANEVICLSHHLTRRMFSILLFATTLNESSL
jgi:hypothetical protein